MSRYIANPNPNPSSSPFSEGSTPRSALIVDFRSDSVGGLSVLEEVGVA